MLRRHTFAAAYTTSFLDLCCCALGGMILLMVLLIPSPRSERVEIPTRVVTFQVRLPVVMSGRRPADDWPPFGADSYRTLFAARSATVEVFTLPARHTEATATEEEIAKLIVDAESKTTETGFGTIAISARRDDERPIDFGFPRAATRTPKDRHAVLTVSAGLSVPEDAPEWPLQVGMRLSFACPSQRVPLWTRRLLDQVVGERTTVPAPNEAEVADDRVFASVRVEPRSQFTEMRLLFPQVGVDPAGSSLLLELPDRPEEAARLAAAAKELGLQVGNGGSGRKKVSGPAGVPGTASFDLHLAATISLTTDSRGFSMPQVDTFTLTTKQP